MALPRKLAVPRSHSGRSATVKVTRYACRTALAVACTATVMNGWAQQAATPAGMLSPEIVKQIEAAGIPIGESLSRNRRMTDPNAGKRPGDEKLNCEQIKTEFDDTNKKYDAQAVKTKTAQDAVEADAAKYASEISGPGAIASGFFTGLAAHGAHATGAGDAFNEKKKAELMAEQAKRQELNAQMAQQQEAIKALADRGQTLMNLGKAKGCKGISITQQGKEVR